MTIDDLKAIITGSVRNDVFTFPNATYSLDDLDSPDIFNLFVAYLDDATLTINDVTISQTSDDITISGSGGSLPFLSTNIDVKFALDGAGTPTFLAIALAQTGWTFATSYPVLSDTFIADLTFDSGHGFTLSSVASDDTPFGLVFSGDLQLNTILSTVSWLLGNGSSLTVTGPIEPHQGVPEMTLSADVLSPVTLGYFQLAAVNYQITSALVPGESDEDAPTAAARMHFNSAVQYHSESTNVSIPISADFEPSMLYLSFSADLNNALLGTLDELSSLMDNAALSSMFTSTDIGSYLSLSRLSLLVDPSTKSLLSVSMGVRSADTWDLLTDPTFGTVFAVNDIELSFRMFDPMGDANIVMVVFGDLMLMDSAEFKVNAVYPGFSVNGALEDDTSLNLVDVVDYFTGLNLSSEVPDINLDQLDFSLQPSASSYEIAAAFSSNWNIPLGITTLVLQDLDFSVAYSGSGETSAHIGGSMQIGSAEVAARWQLNEDDVDMQLEATISEISLSDLVNAVSSTPLRSDFPDLTLENTQLLIAKYDSGNYFLALGTTVDNFGTLELDFKEVISDGRSTTGYAFGFMLPVGWSLSQLSSALAPLDFLTFDSAAMTVASYTDPNFNFRALSGETVASPFAPAGVQEGVGFYAALSLNSSNGLIQTLNRLLPGLADEGLVISMLVPSNMANTQVAAAITSPLTILDVTTHLNNGQQQTAITFNEFSAVIDPANLYFDVHLDVLLTIFDESLELSGDMAIKGEEALLAVRTETPWVEPFGIQGLTIDGAGIEFEVGPILALTLAGEITLGTGQSAVALKAAAEFNIDEEGIPDVLLARETGSINIGHLISTFVGNGHVPSDLMDVEIADFQFLVVANPEGWTDPLDFKHYSPGIAVSGEVMVKGLIADFAVEIDFDSGLIAHGALNESVTIGPLTLANASDATIGPYITIQSAQSPYISMSVALTLFEIQTIVEAFVADDAFSFTFEENVAGFGNVSVNAALQGDEIDGHSFDAHATSYVHLDGSDIPSLISTGNSHTYELGPLKHLTLDLDANFDLDVGPGAALALDLGASFELGNIRMTLPSTSIHVDSSTLSSFTDILTHYAQVLADQLWDIGADLFQDAQALFNFVYDGFMTLTDDIGNILKKQLGAAMDEAAQLMESISDIMQYTVDDVTNYLKDGWQNATSHLERDISQALRSASYAVDEIAATIGNVFNKGADAVAQILKDAAFEIDEIATALKNVFGWAAEDVANFFKSAWGIADNIVHDALQVAGYAASTIENAMKSAFGWVTHAAHKVTHYLNPKHW